MDLNDVADALAEKLGAIPGLRVHPEVPQQVNPPAAVIGLGSGAFVTFDADTTVNFGILLLLTASDARRTQRTLRDYCNATGTMSIKAAIEADGDDLQLAGVSTGTSAACNRWDPPGVVTIGTTDYVGVEFEVTVVG